MGWMTKVRFLCVIASNIACLSHGPFWCHFSLCLASGGSTCGANHDSSRKALLVHWPTAFLNAEFPTDSPSPLVSCLPVDGNDNSLYNDA
jgi:hypothetical protein